MKLLYADAKHFKCNDLRRWKLEVGNLFSVRLHHWVAGDPKVYQHAHPWNFITFVLRGGYDDVGEGRSPDRVRAPAFRYRPLTWRHSVINVLPGTWSIVLAGKVVRPWQFWIGSRQVDVNEWNDRSC